MKRYSDTWIILKDDLESGLVKKQTIKHEGDTYTEYWVYALKESNLYDAGGKKFHNQKDSYLRGIISCAEEGKFYETDKAVIVSGVRFTEENIREYLESTGRSI